MQNANSPSICSILMFVIVCSICTIWHSCAPSPQIDINILQERIAVLPFNNNTNDEDLDILGDMAADWINTGLMGIGNAEVVSPFTVRTHKEAIGILENDPEDRPSFAQLTGAQNLISGSYYKEKNAIIFKLELINAFDGQMIFSFDEIRGTEEDKEGLITQLREKVIGYWAARDLVNSKKIKAPKYEAYELYLKTLNSVKTGNAYRNMIAMDSSFYLARIQFLNLNTAGVEGDNLPHFKYLERHQSELSEYETAWLNYLKGSYLGEIESAFTSLNEIRIKYPKDFVLNHVTATAAFEGLNNPELALSIYQELPLEANHSKLLRMHYNHRVSNVFVSLIQLNKVEEAISFIESTPILPIENTFVASENAIGVNIYRASIRQDQTQLLAAYDDMKQFMDNKPFQYFAAAIHLINTVFITEEFRDLLKKDMVSFYRQLSPLDINRTLWANVVARVEGNVQMARINNLEFLPRTFQIVNLAAAVRLYQEKGMKKEAKIAADRILNLAKPDYTVHSSLGVGIAYYLLGRYHVLNGDFDKAIASLRKARRYGAATRMTYFQFDQMLEPLFDRPDFKQLCEPIWPAGDQAKVLVHALHQYKGSTKKLEDLTSTFKDNEQIFLSPGDRFFNLELSTTNYANNNDVVYYYKVNGLDGDWSTSDQEVITISALPYGDQTLSIKALFPSGRFTEEILEIPVSIKKPFYLELWFIIGSILAVLFGVRLWTYRLQKQKDFLEKEVAKRTAQIKQQSEELRAMDQMKSKFFANVSHELRTPLTLILSPLEKILKRQDKSNQDFMLLKMMQQNGEDLLKLTNEILDLTKLESSKLELVEKPVAIYPFLQRLISVFETYAQKQSIALTFEYKASPDLQVQLDANKFEKIINNLLANAIKFTPQDGAVKMKIEDLGYSLEIKVSDTGRGIHEDDLPHIFDRFYQSKQEGVATEGGTGIGLALVQEFVKLFEGTISVESELHKGSVFTFTLPKKQVLKALDNKDALAIQELKNKKNGSVLEERVSALHLVGAEKKRTANADLPLILIVEDNGQLREYIELILGNEFQVVATENGQVALDWLQSQEESKAYPDLIVSDVMMPVMDGFKLLQELKTTPQYCTIPVVMLTARAELEDKLNALRIGVDDYMIKPFVEEELLTRVQNLLSNARSRKTVTSEVESNQLELAQEQNGRAINIENAPAINKEDLEWLADFEQKILDTISDFDFNLEALSSMIFLSPRQIRRRLKKLTGLTFSQYLRAARFKEARRLLELREVKTIKQLAYKVGMRDVKYFSQQFKKHFGKSPSAYLD